MLSKDELVRTVAQSCGVATDVSSFFFEVFVNRLSNKLKPGDLLHFHNQGFFHKRNCRIQIEKTSDSPTPKSYLIQLVLFSATSKIRHDLSDIHFLKIPNLKTLWVDDKDFQKSLNAGDFAPYTDRNQLIKSFATKAEVIISSLRKDYDSELVDELIIPLTFDLNFLVKRSQKGSPSNVRSENESLSKKEDETEETKKLKPVPGTAEAAAEEGLPWNYGTKFLEKDKQGGGDAVVKNKSTDNLRDRNAVNRNQKDLRQQQAARLKDFEPVPSHTVLPKDKVEADGPKKVKFSVEQTKSAETKKSVQSDRFTEVKSKSESYRPKKDSVKFNKGKFDKYPSIRSVGEKPFTARRNYLPIIAIVSFAIIVLALVYIYFFKGESTSSAVDIKFAMVKPPPNVNLIERDYDFTVSYPYPKMDDKVELSGFNREELFSIDKKPVVTKELKPEIKPEVKTESKQENVTEVKETPVVKEEQPIQPIVEEQKPPVKETPEQNNRIFLYRGFYVVYVGTYGSEEVADREADKYFDLGYNAIVEVVDNRGRGREYKLNVGDFTSEEFARQFQEKYLK